MTTNSTNPRTSSKAVLVLLVLGLALAGVALAPAASALCAQAHDESGLYRISVGGCRTYVDVDGDRILPPP